MPNTRKDFYSITRKKRRRITKKQKKIAENKMVETEISDEHEEIMDFKSSRTSKKETETPGHKVTEVICVLGALVSLIEILKEYLY